MNKQICDGSTSIGENVRIYSGDGSFSLENLNAMSITGYYDGRGEAAGLNCQRQGVYTFMIEIENVPQKYHLFRGGAFGG